MNYVVGLFADTLNLQPDTTSEAPSFLRSTRSRNPSANSDPSKGPILEPFYPLTPLESQMRDIVINVYGQKPSSTTSVVKPLAAPGVSKADKTDKNIGISQPLQEMSSKALLTPTHKPVDQPLPSHQVHKTESLPGFFSAEDKPTLDNERMPLSFPPLTSGSVLSNVHGKTNRPVALMHPSIQPIFDKPVSSPLPIFSPQDPPLVSMSSQPSLHNAFLMPEPTNINDLPQTEQSTSLVHQAMSSRPHDNDEESLKSFSITSEPVCNRDYDMSPTTPTPSLPGGLRIPFSSPQMPAHLKTSRRGDTSTLTPEQKLPPSSLQIHQPDKPTQPKSFPTSPVFRSTPRKEFTGHNLSFIRIQDPLEDTRSDPLTVSGSLRMPGQAIRTHTKPDITESPPSLPIMSNINKVPITYRSFSHNDGDDISGLKEQVHQLMQQKANLEGQLESIVEECQSTLKERAQLQSKLAKAEVELGSLSDEIKNRNHTKRAGTPSEDGTDLQTEIDRLESTLSKKRRELATMSREIEREKSHAKQLSTDLIAAHQQIEHKDQQLQDLQTTNSSLTDAIEKKADTIQELTGQVSSLQAKVESANSSKSWLHSQLQDAVDSKLKLQEELRAARTTTIGQNVKIDNLQKENMLFKQQIHDLQNSILQDKAKLVTELEAIEADVLSKEGSFAEVQADKDHLEQLIQLKTKQFDQLSSKLAEQESTRADLDNQLSDAKQEIETLQVQIKKLNDGKNRLTNDLQQKNQQLASKDHDMSEIKRSKSALQQRLQQAETSLVSKEGTLQGLKDSLNIMKHEMETVKLSRENTESELNHAQETIARLEADVEASETRANKLEAELHHLRTKQQQSDLVTASLQSQLANKEAELDERGSMLDSLQSQSEDIRQQFHSLQNQFQNIASESGAGLEEKEHIIEQLVKERQNLEDQMSDLTASEAQLKESMASLKEQNAHLQGQLESAVTSGPNLDDFKRVLKEKNALDNQLGSERLAHQQELIKTQAKVARVETELRDTKRESKRKEKNLREELSTAQERVKELQDALDKVQHDLVVPESANTEDTEALQYALQEKDQEIQYLQEAKITLEEENSELRERLKEETDHVAEIERASCLVAQQLKENALEIEDRLKREKSELAVEIEHLKGRLAGINTAQQCMREHATSLENSLAQKESQLTKLASETSSLLGDKDREISELNSTVATLQDNDSYLKSELEQALNDALLEKQRADDTQRQLTMKEEELTHLKFLPSNERELQSLKEQVSMLEQVKNDLQAEVRTLKQQLSNIQSTSKSTSRELQEKTQLVDFLQQELKLAQDQLQQSQEELAHYHHVQERQGHEIESLKKAQLALHKSLPTTDSDDDVKDNGRYQTQLVQEMGSQLQRARREGEEAAERKSSGEISVLRSQLGSKSKTLKNLQSCLRSLKDDMGQMQSQMTHHSHSLLESYKSSQYLEDRIRDLQRSHSDSGTVSPSPTTPNKTSK